MNQQSANRQNASPAKNPLWPNLTFFFAWIAGTAVFLLLWGSSQWSHPVAAAANLTNCALHGAQLATWWYLIRRWAGTPVAFPSLPGHWLCLLGPLVELAIAA